MITRKENQRWSQTQSKEGKVARDLKFVTGRVTNQVRSKTRNSECEPKYTPPRKMVPDNSVGIWGQHPRWPGSQASLSQCSCRYKAGTQSPPGDLSGWQKKPFLQKAVTNVKRILSGFNLSVSKLSFLLGSWTSVFPFYGEPLAVYSLSSLKSPGESAYSAVGPFHSLALLMQETLGMQLFFWKRMVLETTFPSAQPCQASPPPGYTSHDSLPPGPSFSLPMPKDCLLQSINPRLLQTLKGLKVKFCHY